MAYFKICVRAKRNDNTYPIYIRVTHHGSAGYIKTDKVCRPKSVKKGEVIDNYIIKDLSVLIDSYIDRLNREDTSDWDVKKIISFLKSGTGSPSFTSFCEEFTKKMDNEGRQSTSLNYKLAIGRLKDFMNRDEISFSDITSSVFRDWIDSMKGSLYKKHGYPNRIKTMFRAGCERYNNYDTGEMVIRNDPFRGVKIPKPVVPKKRALDIDVIRKFFASDLSSLPERINGLDPKAVRAKDVCMMVFCLAGINTADLYHVGKECLKDGKLCYCRRKTSGRRDDKAYIEVSVPERLLPLFEKYRGKKKLFSFSETYCNSRDFNKAVNQGLRKISSMSELPYISVYSFRHSWATIAQNVFEADLDLIGFCLNHASSHRVTAGYVKVDFSPIDKMNDKILGYVFEKIIRKKTDKNLVAKK